MNVWQKIKDFVIGVWNKTKAFFQKIKNPLKYAGLVLLTGMYLFSIIDGVVRCFHGEIFNGIVQTAFLLVLIPGYAILFNIVIHDATR